MKGINFNIILNRKIVLKLYRLVTDFVDASHMTLLIVVVASLVSTLQSCSAVVVTIFTIIIIMIIIIIQSHLYSLKFSGEYL